MGGCIVKKEQLREAFTSLGFQKVSTFKQSGNVIFEITTVNTENIKNKVELKLHGMLGYEVTVLLRTIEQLRSIIEQEPFKGQNEAGASFLVTMLPEMLDKFPLQLPLSIPKSTAQVISAKGTEVFSVTHGGGEGALPNPFIESKLKVKATTRNMNVIREIVEKYS